MRVERTDGNVQNGILKQAHDLERETMIMKEAYLYGGCGGVGYRLKCGFSYSLTSIDDDTDTVKWSSIISGLDLLGQGRSPEKPRGEYMNGGKGSELLREVYTVPVRYASRNKLRNVRGIFKTEKNTQYDRQNGTGKGGVPERTSVLLVTRPGQGPRR